MLVGKFVHGKSYPWVEYFEVRKGSPCLASRMITIFFSSPFLLVRIGSRERLSLAYSTTAVDVILPEVCFFQTMKG